MLKLAVGVPWASPFYWTEAHDAMLNLQRPASARNQWGVREALEVRFFRGKGWCPARRHGDICEQALAWGADLICIMGADQIHPEDTLVKLVDRWNEGCDVIAALVPARGYVGWMGMKPFQRMAWRVKRPLARSIEELNALVDQPNEREVVDPAEGDLLPINFIGSGVLMFATAHLLMLEQPWFFEKYNPKTMQRLASMDTTFVWRLQTEAGAKVWVDTTIKVQHLHAFPVDETYAERFTDWMTPGVGDPNVCMFDNPLDQKAG